jgi:ABC-type branched-subunit amino acid transport system permease subunit
MGAVVFEVIKLVAAAYLTGIWQLLLGATLIIVILLAPAGLTGVLLAKRKRADRESFERADPMTEKG